MFKLSFYHIWNRSENKMLSVSVSVKYHLETKNITFIFSMFLPDTHHIFDYILEKNTWSNLQI